jgi:hypothetical protein
MGGKLAVTREDWIAKASPDSFGVEIGVLEGEFSQVILSHNPRKLVLVDAWLHFESGYTDPANVDQGGQESRFRGVTERFSNDPRVTIVRALSRSEEIAPALRGNPDWIYIDANHSEDECYQDLCFYSQFTTTLAVHDYLPDDNHLGFGVKGAVDRFLGLGGWGIDLVTDEDWPTVILKKK